ncbi:MAG: helix-turn-helix transcriptional regulator [Bdellovibrionales bacterium]
MITAAQLRAARGLLDWSRSELSKASKVSQETIKNIEHGVFRPQETTEESIVNAFAIHGVEFVEDEGVRKSQNKVHVYKGEKGFKDFLDDVYVAAQKQYDGTDGGNKQICLSNVDDRFFIKHLYEYSLFHAKRMVALGEKIKVRILVNETAALKIPGRDYREYRVQAGSTEGNVPFYVYGDKLGIMIFEEDKEPQIVVVSSPLVAKAYREQFNVLWKSAKPLAASHD